MIQKMSSIREKDGPFAYHDAGVTQIANERRKGDLDENELKYRNVGVLSRIAKSSVPRDRVRG